MSDHQHDSHGGHADTEVHVHISTTKELLTVLGALFVLTGVTLGCYLIRLGDANLLVALLIAMVKATLVGTFFMHLKHEKPFNTLFFVGTLAFIGVFFFFTWNDTVHRGETDYRSGRRYDYRHEEWAQGVPPGLAEGHGELRDVSAAEHAEGAEHAAGEAPAAPAAH